MQSATLEILEQAEVPPRQARALGRAIEIEVCALLSYFATKLDLKDGLAALRIEMHQEFAAVRGEMHQEFAAVRGEMHREFATVRGEMRTEFAAVRVEMREIKSELVRWIFMVVMGQTAMLLGAGYFLVNLIR